MGDNLTLGVYMGISFICIIFHNLPPVQNKCYILGQSIPFNLRKDSISFKMLGNKANAQLQNKHCII